MKTKQHPIPKIAFSWLILLVIVAGSVNDPTIFGNAEFEDAIELSKKEVKDGEKEVKILFLQIFDIKNDVLRNELISIFHLLEENAINHTPDKLYILYHQFKSHPG